MTQEDGKEKFVRRFGRKTRRKESMLDTKTE